MSGTSDADALLIDRIRGGNADAWSDLIARYEGRLLAFAESRLGRGHGGEDVVQETFIGFLHSLPNFDGRRPLEGYLFSICAHKLTDHLRREGRRPALPLSTSATSGESPWQIAASARAASSVVQSSERRQLEEQALAEALRQQVHYWRQRGDWIKIQCAELLFVLGWPNKDVAVRLGLSEQQVANYKFDFLARMRNLLRNQGLSMDLFPDLYQD